MKMMFDLTGKVALVTGSSGSLGGPIARALSEAGAAVACHYNNSREPAEKVVNDLSGLGRRCSLLQADLTDPRAAERLVDETVESLGDLNILVNNAGVSKEALFIRQPAELINEILTANLASMFYVSSAAGRVMAKNRWGRLIHMGSVVSDLGSTAQTAYAASKAGILGMSRGIARELGGRNITSNVVSPGLIDAGMTGKMSDARRETTMPFIALGRMGSVNDVVGAVVFLSSDEAGYITGTVLSINGGLYM